MTDKREQILVKLQDVMAALVPDGHCFRNRGELPAGKRPGIIVLDGDEDSQRSADHRGRPPPSPNLVTMKPEIYFQLDDRKIRNKDVGSDLNAMRAQIVKAVLTTAGLTGLCHEVFYGGLVTDLASGRAMTGQMGLLFEFTYYLKPAEL